jgi:hypothetical protein
VFVPENHGREVLKTSRNAKSGLQSSMRVRFVPIGDRCANAGVVVTEMTATTIAGRMKTEHLVTVAGL